MRQGLLHPEALQQLRGFLLTDLKPHSDRREKKITAGIVASGTC